ncbi:hypothetical protein D6C95_09210, partial [Aureobasidium pullulans]
IIPLSLPCASALAPSSTRPQTSSPPSHRQPPRHNVRAALRPLHSLRPDWRRQQRWQPAYRCPPSRNRLDRQCHAQQHQQGLRARRAPRQSARQDRQPGRLGAGLQTWCQQSQKADVVEGHEDENVPDHRHHHPAGHHHCPQCRRNKTSL